MPTFRACLKLIALVLLVIAIIPTQSLLLLSPFDGIASRWAQWWHKAVCLVLGIAIELEGRPEVAHVAYVGNHLSYIDIPVLGSIVRGSFVAKQEMRGWPLFGWLARLQRTVFISRNSSDAAHVMDQLDAMLSGSRNLIVFPEGTSSSGERVLPFKSSVFSVLGEHLPRGLRIQPFTLDLRVVDGHAPCTADDRNLYAYHSHMVLAPHLWAFMRTRGASLRVVFHPVLGIGYDSNRKRIAVLAERSVASALSGLSAPVDSRDVVVAGVEQKESP